MTNPTHTQAPPVVTPPVLAGSVPLRVGPLVLACQRLRTATPAVTASKLTVSTDLAAQAAVVLAKAGVPKLTLAVNAALPIGSWSVS